jgi:RHS repeat-associated protein
LTSVGDWTSVTTNGTAQNRTHGPTHELLTAGGQNVATDVKGNITTLPVNLRPAGSTTAMNLNWDSDNKLRSADIDANGTADVNFQYDALGRRVARSGTGGSVVFVQMDQQTIADYPVGGAATTPTFRYVYASYIDEPVVRKTAGTGGTLVYFHRNHQYSVTAVTTSTGTIAERYAYTAYGLPTILDASGLPLTPQSSTLSNRYTYTGREWDATLALHHFRARWMSPIAGRFLGRDPIGYTGSEWNLAEIMLSKPQQELDPLGLLSVTPHSNNFKSRQPCWDWATIQWNFSLSAPAEQLCPNTKKGYIVQHVSISCKDAPCDRSGNCDLASVKLGGGEYWEIWEVQGKSQSPIGQPTDTSSIGFKVDGCGAIASVGTIRFYCSDDLSSADINAMVQPVTVNTCGTSFTSIALPGWLTEPTFWNTRSRDGEKHRFGTRSWKCCHCNVGNFDNANGSPR